jgi:hypothetical protein
VARGAVIRPASWMIPSALPGGDVSPRAIGNRGAARRDEGPASGIGVMHAAGRIGTRPAIGALMPAIPESQMSHSPPVPPANQSPYPRVEPAHSHHDATRQAKPAPARPGDRASADRRIRTGIAAALGIGAVAALVAAIAAARREPPARPAPGPKKAAKKKH